MAAVDAGKSFLSSVLAKLPEEMRGQAEKIFTAPEATDALTVLGTGALGQSEINRRLNELKEQEATLKEEQATLTADYEKLNGWYATNKDRLAKVETLEQQIARLNGQPPPPTPDKSVPDKPAGLSKEDFDAALAARDEGYAGVLAFTTTLGIKHLRDFNEVLDVADLIATARKGRKSLADAYQEKFGEKLKAKADAEEATRIDKLVADRLAEERKKQAEQPFPLRNAQPSVLDVLNQPDHKPSDYTAERAAEEYLRLESARQ